jgi:predicted dehydrogenase
VHGANGSYVKSGIDVQEPQLRSGMRATDAAFGVEPQSQWGTFTDGATSINEVVASERGRWTEFYSQVRDCIERGLPPPVPALEARDVIRVIEAAIDSSERGVRVGLD